MPTILRTMGRPAQVCRDLGITASECRDAGYMVDELHPLCRRARLTLGPLAGCMCPWRLDDEGPEVVLGDPTQGNCMYGTISAVDPLCDEMECGADISVTFSDGTLCNGFKGGARVSLTTAQVHAEAETV